MKPAPKVSLVAFGAGYHVYYRSESDLPMGVWRRRSFRCGTTPSQAVTRVIPLLDRRPIGSRPAAADEPSALAGYPSYPRFFQLYLAFQLFASCAKRLGYLGWLLESSAKFQSIAETGKLAVVYKEIL